MVFFTCNACGQCVKKVHVEKHYLTECRNCEVLSCMDCGKDFVGDDYKHHTQCISENEKYGGKDYKANAKPNKGELKQSLWIQNVKSAGSSQSLDPRVKTLLERLENYDNIPRKKAKFERFVQNSLKVYDSRMIEQIWAIYSDAGAIQKKAEMELQQTEEKTLDIVVQEQTDSNHSKKGLPSGKMKKEKRSGNKSVKDTEEEDIDETARTAKAKKEERKRKADNGTVKKKDKIKSPLDEKAAEETVAVHEDGDRRKKRKKKHHEKLKDESTDVELKLEDGAPKKKSKLKKDHERNKSINGHKSHDDDTPSLKKVNKKDKIRKKESETEVVGVKDVSHVILTKKHKKKPRKQIDDKADIMDGMPCVKKIGLSN